jgi:uncharacterized membrane protein
MGPELAKVVDRNIRALIERRLRENANKSFQEKAAEAVSRFAGSLLFVYLHLILFGGWILWNLPQIPVGPKFDADFVKLAMFASVEAIFISTFVLITQNRMAAQADRRADLDLQISLLSEHEITRMLTLVQELARKFNVEESERPELEELSKDVHPEKVLDRIEQTEKRLQP